MKSMLLTLSLLLVVASFAICAETPNVIIILTDDQGYQDLGCYGSPDIKTPNIDKLASGGMRFTDYYVASPVCSASRAALLTGRYPMRLGIRGVFFPNRNQGGLAPKEVTIAEILKAEGYATQAVGKWHLGDEPTFLPTNQGFEAYYGIPYSNDMTPAKSMAYSEDCIWREGFSAEKLETIFEKNDNIKKLGVRDKVPLMRNEQCIEFPADQRTITRRYTDEGIHFVKASAEKKEPFFLYLAHSMPHTPLFVSEDFEGESERGLYGDVIEEIDYNVGRLLDTLDELEIADNTIVVYTSDNGPWLIKGDHGGSALPLFEGKMTHFEGGQRVPAIVRWPGNVPEDSTCSEMVFSMDLLPTITQIVGGTLPDVKLDGLDIRPLLMGEAGAVTPHQYFFFNHLAVRSGDWKYHQTERFKVKATARPTKGPSLYNLKKDIGEANNVIHEFPEVASRLRKALEDHKAAMNQP